jgi:hypothetical protein
MAFDVFAVKSVALLMRPKIRWAVVDLRRECNHVWDVVCADRARYTILLIYGHG